MYAILILLYVQAIIIIIVCYDLYESLHGDRSGMATILLKPSNPFDFKHPDNWQKWKLRFDQYCRASGLASGIEQQQVSTLLYCLGEQADNVLSSTGISEENRKKYSEVMMKFDDYLKI